MWFKNKKMPTIEHDLIYNIKAEQNIAYSGSDFFFVNDKILLKT